MNDLISVVLTTYDSPYKLYRALKSVLNQSYSNIEVLVVDGGNNRCTKIPINLFNDKRIIYIKVGNDKIKKVNRICGNVNFCRNLGVDLSQGKFIAMLDDDDIWSKEKLLDQSKLAMISKASLVGCQTLKYSGNFRHIDKPHSNPLYEDLLQSFCYSQTSCYFMNRKDLIKVGGFNEDLRSMHEYDIALRMAKKGMRIITVDKPLVISYCDNVTKRKYYFTKIAELLDLWRIYGRDMGVYLGYVSILLNVLKTVSLISLYALGYIVKDKIWKVIFKLKEKNQSTKT